MGHAYQTNTCWQTHDTMTHYINTLSLCHQITISVDAIILLNAKCVGCDSCLSPCSQYCIHTQTLDIVCIDISIYQLDTPSFLIVRCVCMCMMPTIIMQMYEGSHGF